jgi:sugar phosphate isomerase/epimerase
MAMELTCTSFSFPLLSFEDACRVIALLGIPAVDLGAHAGGSHLQPDEIEHQPAATAERVRRALDAAGLRAADLFPTFGHGFRDRPVNHPDPATRAANLPRFRSFVALCRAVGCPGITLLPGVPWEELGPDGSFDLSVEVLSQYAAIADAAGLRLSVEPHLESIAEAPERARELAERVPGLRLTLDYSHFVAQGLPPERVHPLAPHAGHFHARQAAPGFLQTSAKLGTLDFRDIVGRLKAAGYDGYLCVEYTWQAWRGCDNVDVISETVLLRDQLRRYLGAA